MYTLGTATPVASAVTTAVVLPNTGIASGAISVAIAVAVGLIVWGVTYAHANR